MRFQGVALGCGNFGGVGSSPAFFGQGTSEDEAFAIMDRAWENGIHWFDTADAYGGGRSETFIGRWRSARRPEGLTLTTKVFHSTLGDPDDVGLAPDRIRRQLEGSLSRLGVERVDLYLAHEPDPATPLHETVACFEQLRDEGLIGAWGLSNYDHAGIAEAFRHARPALVQNAYSLLDRADERGRAAALRGERDLVRAVRAALGRLADGQVPARRAVPGGLAHDAAARAVRQFVDDGVFDALDLLRGRGRRARRLDGGARVRVGARRGRRRRVRAESRLATRSILEARDLNLSPAERDRVGSFFS